MFARLARTISKHPVQVLIVWLLVVLASAPLAQLAPKSLTGDTGRVHDSEAWHVQDIIAQSFGQEKVDRTIIVTRSSADPESEPFREAYDRLADRISKLEGVYTTTRYYAPSPLRLHGQVDGSFVTATILETDLEHRDDVLARVRQEVRATTIPGSELLVTGASAITKDFVELSERDTKQSEFSALPVIAIVLVFAFGALVAAGIPLVVGLISITTAMAMLYGLTHLMPVSAFAQSVITMLGLGAGIDYALLMVNRFREELAMGREPRQAAANTARTAGRAVAFSGFTVGIAMGAMLVPELTFVRSMGVGGVLVILVTVLASVTTVPAVLALLGDRVNSPRGLRLGFRSGRSSGFWHAWASRVMRRPWAFTLVIAAILLFLASPTLRMQLGYTGAFGLAPGVESRRGLDLIKPLDLGGSLDTFEMVVDLGAAGGYDAAARSKFRALDASLAAMPDVRLVISPFLTAREDTTAGGGLGDLVALLERSVSKDRRYLRLSVIPAQALKASDIAGWEKRLRGAAIAAGFETVYLGGSPVGSKEFTDNLVHALPLAIGVVFAATFVLLAIAFRSLVIPLKSIVMNTLTVGASYGIVTRVFQEGFGASLIGAPVGAGVIDSSLPLVMFAVTFGLSMDYEIFLLSRVQEGHLAGLSTEDAVAGAVERTAGVITSAALIMLIVFAAFVRGSVVANKTIGLGLGAAVLLDATLVRLMLVPAVLKLAGEWNWWLPAGLRKVMPRVSLEH